MYVLSRWMSNLRGTPESVQDISVLVFRYAIKGGLGLRDRIVSGDRARSSVFPGRNSGYSADDFLIGEPAGRVTCVGIARD